MKKLIIVLLTILTIFSSCKKEQENLAIESITNDAKAIIKTANALGSNQEYNKMGPYKVSTTAIRQGCSGFAGTIQNILSRFQLINMDVKCTPSFPYGFQDRRVTEVSYPSNIESLEKLPVVNFVGGLISNTGNYDALVNLWVSYGFIVVSTNNFINFSPDMHLYGLSGISELNKSPESPLYNKVDLSRVILSGHSAGGAGAIIVTSYPQQAIQVIDPEIKIVGSVPLQAAFSAFGDDVTVPTLILTGEFDVLVPPIRTGYLQHYIRITKAPAWMGVTKNSSHLTPTLELQRNDYAGITVAWLLYKGKDDAAASKYFVGSPYRLTEDQQFIQAPRLFPATELRRVQRNSLAEKLSPLSGSPVQKISTNQ